MRESNSFLRREREKKEGKKNDFVFYRFRNIFPIGNQNYMGKEIVYNVGASVCRKSDSQSKFFSLK